MTKSRKQVANEITSKKTKKQKNTIKSILKNKNKFFNFFNQPLYIDETETKLNIKIERQININYFTFEELNIFLKPLKNKSLGLVEVETVFHC